MTTSTRLCWLLSSALCAFQYGVAPAYAGDFGAQIRDQSGAGLPGAVVAMYPAQRNDASVKPPVTAIMDQRRLSFVPHVLVIQVGTPVEFPNSDQVRHHVYSFSPAKKFELRLYKGTPASPVVFDEPGLVTLGCNIHDWMVAYIDVVATPYFAQADATGRVALDALPPGSYRLEVWHPRLGDVSDAYTETVNVGSAAIDREISLTLGPPEPEPSVPSELEQKFRRYQSQEP